MKQRHIRQAGSLSKVGPLIGLGAASAAHAAIQMGTPLPLIDTDFNTFWDIDGNGVGDFNIMVDNTMDSSSSQFRVRMSDFAGGFGGKVATTNGSQFAVLTDNAVVDSNYGFRGAIQANISITSLASGGGGNTNSSLSSLSNITQNTPTVVGFSFQRSMNTHYAIGTLTYSVGIGFASLEISDVYWNDVAGEGISASAVPEPSNAALGLGLLALGAAGVSRWRGGRNS